MPWALSERMMNMQRMKLGHKLLTTIMTLTFLTAMTAPAFAETTTPPSQVEKSSHHGGSNENRG